MRVVIIGGTGHVGTFLVPRLVEAGHEVFCLSRVERKIDGVSEQLDGHGIGMKILFQAVVENLECFIQFVDVQQTQG